MLRNKMGKAKAALLAFSLLGGIYCLLNAAGAELFCGTQGCDIYAGYGLFGISFYWYGFAGFLGIFLLALLHPRRGAGLLLAIAVGAALFFDSLFLVYQYLLWPCSSCHVVALLIGLCALFAVLGLKVPGRKLLTAVGLFWAVFFIFVGLAVVKEVAFSPWPIYGSPESSIKVYFSPTCPACEDVARKVLNNPQTAAKTAFYPVAKNATDEARLARLLRQPVGTVNVAGVLGLFDQEPNPQADLSDWEKFLLFRNKMALARAGAAKVPLIISPNIIEIDSLEDDIFLPIENLWESPVEKTSDVGCSAFINDDDCEE